MEFMQPAIRFRTFETERLKLREITPEGFEFLMSNHDDDYIKDFLGLRTEEELTKEKNRFKSGCASFIYSFRLYKLIDKDTDKVIGGCGYHTWVKMHRRAEIGYALSEDAYKRKGLMKEAMQCILTIGFNEMNLHRIEACIGPNNIASINLVKSFGFNAEGLMKEHYLKDGIFHDSLIFALLKSDYNYHITPAEIS